MPIRLKLEIVSDKNILQIYESEPGKLTFVMYPEDPRVEAYLKLLL